jgi:hypothetical protein
MSRKSKKGWANPSKIVEKTSEGRCPYCHKAVKSLEHHIKSKHRLAKLIKRK